MSRNPLLKAAQELEASGFAKGYRQGIKDARREFNATLDRLLFDANVPANGVDTKAPASESQEGFFPNVVAAAFTDTVTIRPTAKKKRKPRPNSDQSRVLECIQNSPGLRGVEVVQRLSGDNPVQERTVRTAIARLKRGGLITQDSTTGGWFARSPH